MLPRTQMGLASRPSLCAEVDLVATVEVVKVLTVVVRRVVTSAVLGVSASLVEAGL